MNVVLYVLNVLSWNKSLVGVTISIIIIYSEEVWDIQGQRVEVAVILSSEKTPGR